MVDRLHQTFKLDSFGIVAEARRPTQEGGGSIPAKVDTKPNTSKCRSREYHPYIETNCILLLYAKSTEWKPGKMKSIRCVTKNS